jgi:hypothetical protein
MSTKNIYVDTSDKNDFGFTFANEEEIMTSNTQHLSLTEQVEDLRQRLHAVNTIFMPLLENLSKDSDKPMIKWPNRKEILDKQIRKLKTLTNV